jgi:hypothetical protein
MKLFECQACGQPLFFESFTCESCGRRLGYLPEVQELSALEPDGETWPAYSQIFWTVRSGKRLGTTSLPYFNHTTS